MEIRASARKIEIWASTGKGGIRASIGEGPGLVPESGNLGEYQRKVESGRVPEKGRNLGEYQRRVQASTGKGGIRASIGEGPG